VALRFFFSLVKQQKSCWKLREEMTIEFSDISFPLLTLGLAFLLIKVLIAAAPQSRRL
jgi:hypothetical protein